MTSDEATVNRIAERRRMAEHDREVRADAWDEGALWAAVELGVLSRPENRWLAPGDNPYRT